MTRLPGKLLELFDRRERRQFAWILLTMLVMALVSTFGVAAIMPFMSLLANPGAVHDNRWLSYAYELFGFSSPTAFLFAIGIATLLLLMFSNALRAFTDWMILRFVRDMQHELSRRLLAQYLSEPYAFFLNRNTATLSKNIFSEVGAVINGVLMLFMKGLSQGVLAISILVLLIAVDVWLALSIAFIFGALYGLIFAGIRKKQAELGRERLVANSLRFKAADEAFGGIKDVKVLGREHHFIDRFERPSRRFMRAVASNQMMSQLPHYALETLTFGGILIIILYLLGTGHSMEGALPLLSLYAFAAYRLMPSLQQVFLSVTQIRFNTPALEELHHDLANIGRSTPLHSSREAVSAAAPPPAPPALALELRLSGVSFTYPGAEEPALRGVDLSLPRNQTIGLVGATGAGKTTLVDLILGLYLPDRGSIAVDGVELTEAMLPVWRRQVGYVPQQIFLSDDSVLNNIAFGVPDSEIDCPAAERAAEIAQLHDFILTLPEGYATVVGERGIRLSGGQRQRIGIARALYQDPEVLIMDEATSALDTLTEDAVMEAIRRLAGRKTMVLIAHRLSTVEDCDLIYLLDHGRVTGCGTYQELRRTHSVFQAMAGGAPPVPA